MICEYSRRTNGEYSICIFAVQSAFSPATPTYKRLVRQAMMIVSEGAGTGSTSLTKAAKRESGGEQLGHLDKLAMWRTKRRTFFGSSRIRLAARYFQ
jgi:hypothetical protein